MIEKKTMGYVDFGYPQYEAKTVTVMTETETGVVELFKPEEDSSEWQQPDENEHFYATLQEAQEALAARRKELRELMPRVKEWVEQMDNLRETVKEKPGEDDDEYEWRKEHPEYFSKHDYLPYRYAKRGDDDYYEGEFNRCRKERDMIVGLFRTGFLNIRGDQFRLSDVESVRWGNGCAEVVLKGGKAVKTVADFDYNVVGYLFGQNVSGFTYTRLEKDKED